MRKYLLLTLIVILALAIGGCAPTTAPSTKAILTGRVVVPQGALRQVGGQALPGATVNVIDPVTGNIVATTTTDANGYYRIEVPPGGPYIVEAVKGNLKVLRVSPQVEAGKTYDLGTADATSTAIALVFQAKVEAGEDPAQIDLEEIAEDRKIKEELAQAIEEALAAGEDPTTAPEVIRLVDIIVSPPKPAPAPGPAPAPTYTITATAGAGGKIEPSGEVKVSAGVDQKFTITPNRGYQIADVVVDGESVLGDVTIIDGVGTYTFKDVKANHTISVTFKNDTTPPTLQSVSPQRGEVILSSRETFKFTVDAYDAGGLYELEIDHSLEDVFPEFSVYADKNNPYGTAEDKAAFGDLGVMVTYNATEQKWAIDFGEQVTDTIISKHGGKITFYIVIKDLAGNKFGSMSPTTSGNTFAYTLKRKAEFTFTVADIKDVIEDLNNSTHQWGLWAVRIRPVIEGEYGVIAASTTQEGWGAEAPSSFPWSVYGTNCAWFYDISGAEKAGNAANPLYMIMDVPANTFWSGGYNKAGQWVADWAPGPDGKPNTEDDITTEWSTPYEDDNYLYPPGYDNGAGGTNVITAVEDGATFTFSFTYTGTWSGQCEFFVDGSKYYLGTDTAPGAFIGNFHGGHSSWSVDNSVDSSGGLSGNTGTGYRIRIGEVG